MKQVILMMVAAVAIASFSGVTVAASTSTEQAVSSGQSAAKEGTWDKTRDSSKELWEAARKTGTHAWEATRETGKEVYQKTREKTVATSKASETLWQSVTRFFSADDSKE